MNPFSKFFTSTLTISVLILAAIPANAQSPEESESKSETIDEIIVRGTTAWEGHDGMDAFRAGDFEKAEIEFEKEFKTLKRAESARYNSAVSASLGIDRAEATGQAGVGGLGSGGPGGGPPVDAGNVSAPDLGVSGNFSNRRSKGKNLLNDGKVTEKDFAFTKYMSGLSEIKLGKYEEAKASLKTSVKFDKKNYDARMRLGLLYVLENDFDKAADQLEALEKIRVKCKAKSCEEYEEILGSAKTLAKGITDKIQTQ